MQNEATQQWINLMTASMDSFKEITEAYWATFNSLGNGPGNVKQFAEFTKAFLTTTQAFNDVYGSTLNNLFKNQLEMVDSPTYATAIKELSTLNVEATNRLMQQQLEMMHTYLESSVNYLENLKQAQNMQEFIGTQMHLFSEIQAKTKANALQTFETLESIKSAISAWTERNLDKTISSNNASQSQQPVKHD